MGKGDPRLLDLLPWTRPQVQFRDFGALRRAYEDVCMINWIKRRKMGETCHQNICLSSFPSLFVKWAKPALKVSFSFPQYRLSCSLEVTSRRVARFGCPAGSDLGMASWFRGIERRVWSTFRTKSARTDDEAVRIVHIIVGKDTIADVVTSTPQLQALLKPELI